MPIINQVVAGSGGGSSVSEPYLEMEVSQNGVLLGSTTTSHKIDLSNVRNIDECRLYRAYWNNTAISGTFDLSNVDEVGTMGLRYFLSGCSNITQVLLNNIQTVSDNGLEEGFRQTAITELNLPKLVSAYSYSFTGVCRSCSSLITAKIGSWKCNDGTNYVFSEAFLGCNSLQTVYFYAIEDTDINNDAYSFATNFEYMLSGCSNVTVHFPKRIEQAVVDNISDMGSFTDGFGGTNTTILYDIITSLTGADSNTYVRTQKDSTSTATAWTYNSTLYYTSGTTEPSVGDTIYSDAACTTSVTTITAIA